MKEKYTTAENYYRQQCLHHHHQQRQQQHQQHRHQNAQIIFMTKETTLLHVEIKTFMPLKIFL